MSGAAAIVHVLPADVPLAERRKRLAAARGDLIRARRRLSTVSRSGDWMATQHAMRAVRRARARLEAWRACCAEVTPS